MHGMCQDVDKILTPESFLDWPAGIDDILEYLQVVFTDWDEHWVTDKRTGKRLRVPILGPGILTVSPDHPMQSGHLMQSGL